MTQVIVVGKRVWFWPTLAAEAYAPYDLNNQPLAGTITHVNVDSTVNISYLNRNGELEAKRTVYLWQPGMKRLAGNFCELHPDDVPTARVERVAPLPDAEEVIQALESPSRPVLTLKRPAAQK